MDPVDAELLFPVARLYNVVCQQATTGSVTPTVTENWPWPRSTEAGLITGEVWGDEPGRACDWHSQSWDLNPGSLVPEPVQLVIKL